jgi:selenide, water dikinase
MDTTTARDRLTAYSHGAGCACKLGPADLTQVLGGLASPVHADLLVGREHGDDSIVWRRPDGTALVASIDVFTPIVDDADTWGRIAAVNAGSDIHAMGGVPLFALAFAAWPRDQLPLDLLGDVLAGGQAAASEGGWVVAGGHTIDGPEPLYGQAVVGEVPEDRLLTNAAGAPGDALVLTKPLGTGLTTTAVKRREPEATTDGGELAELYAAAVAEMTRPNGTAAQLALDLGARCATDVTGFGMLNHLREILAASRVGARIETAAVPRLPGLAPLLAAGEIPGGSQRNLAHVRPHLDVGPTVAEDDLIVLADAQTSGGLLVALPEAAAEELVDGLVATGHLAARIGQLTDDASRRVVVA